MAQTPFDRLKHSTQFINVRMNDEAILLPDSGKSAIGTENLNGCTSIAVLGRAVVLSHISPSNPPVASREHHEQALSKIDDLLNPHREFFPPQTTVWGIYGRIDGEAMDHITQQVQTHFSKTGIATAAGFYEVAEPTTRRTPAAGQLVVYVNEAGTTVYLEDRKLDFKTEPKRRARSTTSSSTELPSAASTSRSSGGPSGLDRSSRIPAQQPTSQQMKADADHAKAVYAGLLRSGSTPEQALWTMATAFARNRQNMSHDQALVAVRGRLYYQG